MGTASNKIYEYAACGLPVIVSDQPNYREHLANESWVRFADPDNPKSIASAVEDIMSDFNKYQAMCLAARQAFEEKYNYESAFYPLFKTIQELVCGSEVKISSENLDVNFPKSTKVYFENMYMDTQSHPKISILLPVFNGQRYIRECINSILNQSFTNFELLISNDCSTDDSHNIIQEFSDPRIIYLSNQKNQGLFKNLNLILKLANAPIIRFICQDDILFSDCLENEILFFENHPEIDISFCKSHIIDRNGMTLSQGALKDLPDVIDSHLSMQLFYYYGCIPGNLSTVCIRENVLMKLAYLTNHFMFQVIMKCG